MARTLQTNTYTYLYACAKWAREQPIPAQFRGFALYRRIVHTTFLAMTLEAFLNHCGYLRVPWWRSAERTLSTEAKLAIVMEHASVTFRRGARPMQSLDLLLRIRNEIVHGKTVEVPFEDWMIFDENFHATSWLKMLKTCSEDRLHDDVVEAITTVYNAFGFNLIHPSPFGLMGQPKNSP